MFKQECQGCWVIFESESLVEPHCEECLNKKESEYRYGRDLKVCR